MNPEIINSIPKKIRERYLPVENSDNEWKILHVNESESIKIIAGLLARNLKKASQ